jgi:hypothetical protein
MFPDWWQHLLRLPSLPAKPSRHAQSRVRPRLEPLEDRTVPTGPTGNVAPGSINLTLGAGASATTPVSLTLPSSGSPITEADVFLLFDDTGSFASILPTLTSQFPTIISTLTSALPGVSFGFGIGRFEDYGGAAGHAIDMDFPQSRPFILSQPVITPDTANFSNAINAALARTTPGTGGDTPEAMLEGLFQTATGVGFDGDNNGSKLDSGPAGPVSTQVTPGTSGDVPPFSSFTADPANYVLPPAGSLGGAGFRPGALPIILVASDTGTAYQPDGATTITGANGVTVPLSDLTHTSRPVTPFGAGATFQNTINALNKLGALVIGLGTATDSSTDPRADFSGIAKLTGAINGSKNAIDSGISGQPINPGDPLYFKIVPGDAANVAQGIEAAIQAGVASTSLDITVISTDPHVIFNNLTGVDHGVAPGGTANFSVQFTGDGSAHQFSLEFVRANSGTILGSIPVTISVIATTPGSSGPAQQTNGQLVVSLVCSNLDLKKGRLSRRTRGHHRNCMAGKHGKHHSLGRTVHHKSGSRTTATDPGDHD